MEWQIFMTFGFTRRDVVLVPWRGGGGGGGGLKISCTWRLSYMVVLKLFAICIRFWQRVSK